MSYDFTKEDYERLISEVSQAVSSERFEHCKAVGEMLFMLMPSLGRLIADILGMAHDWTHSFSREDNLKIIDDNDIPLYEGERELSPCLHAVTGAWKFRNMFHYADERYYYALRHHTILVNGADEITLNLYVADKIERGRKYLDNEMREKIISMQEPELRAFAVMSDQQRYLTKNGGTLLSCTIDYMNQIRKKYGLKDV